MMMHKAWSVCLAVAMFACAGEVDGDALEQPTETAPPSVADAPIPGVVRGGRLCIAGQTDWIIVHPPGEAVTLFPIVVTPVGEMSCVVVTAGRVVVDAKGSPTFATWVDAKETTTVDLARPFEPSATSPETASLAWIAWQGSCRYIHPGDCMGKADPERLAALGTSGTARERQAVRLVQIPTMEDGPAKQEVAQAILSELEATTYVAMSYPGAVAIAALSLGDDAARALEDAVIEPSGFAIRWLPDSRRTVLAVLLHQAGVGASSDALRARLRSAIDADPDLLGVSFEGQWFVQQLAFDRHMIAAAEQIGGEVLDPFAGTTCEAGSRWLLYVYSTTCGACKGPQREMLELLDSTTDPFRVVSISTLGDVSPKLAERSDVEVAELSPALEQWFVTVRGSTVVPYFFGFVCDESQSLRMVGFGGLEEAIDWTKRAVSTET